MSTARLDLLREIENKVQEKWGQTKVFEIDASPEEAQQKYFITFPYPYMNGKLHLGHGFSLSKSEFAARFQRMCGKRVLWPFGLHVTGTPIAACAQKIMNEIKLYGNPPIFTQEVLEGKVNKENTEVPGQHKSKRGKTGPNKPQWLIMKGLGIPDSEIPLFADPHYWLKYFPSLAVADLKKFGVHVDWRRSFITTDINKFYDSLISWQFRILQRGNYLNFGKRYCIYSPLDNQPCADHDRASGEGVQPLEYTLVKIKVKNPMEHEAFKPFKDLIRERDIILPGATLRSETVIGQTNCWISPDIVYNAYIITGKSGKEEIFLMNPGAARNLAYQDINIRGLTNDKESLPLFEVHGKYLIGLPLSAPYCAYDTIYTLPMSTINHTKGTGIVMSVPSSSPDDYINFTQLVNKPEYRAKIGVKDEWILPFPIIPIIETPGEMGTEGAAYAIKKLAINGPKDAAKLEEAKKMVYQAEFYSGSLITGPFKGLKVSEAKVKMMQDLLEKDMALRFFEPAKPVISRSGDECVVALADQWFIEYGKEEWKKMVLEHLEKMQLYYPGIRNGFEETLNWLADWPCSRTFGLGTKLPFDSTKTMIIDSLSDSTIYMCYYTVSHFFHTATDGNLCLDATKPNIYGITPEMVTDTTWNYVLKGIGTAEEVNEKTGLPVDIALQMRKEFTYWYPVDLRVSAKDLIQNHLTMFLYNHAAIWPDQPNLWPRSIYCNGHIQVDNEKMSKSLGNFIMLREAIDLYSADCCRLACADAGDSMDDANFVRETATGFIMKLTTLIEQIRELISKVDEFRAGELNIFDKIMEDSLNGIIESTKSHYERMAFRMALHTAYFEFIGEFSSYRLACEDTRMHKDLVQRYCRTIVLLLQPLAPHVCEYIWSELLGEKSLILNEPFPESAPKNYQMRVTSRIITDVLKEMRAQIIKNSKKRVVSEVVIYTAESFLPWQISALELLRKIANENGGAFPNDTAKQILSSKPSWITKDIMQDAMGFISFVKMNTEKYGFDALSVSPAVDDYVLLKDLEGYLAKSSNISKVSILKRDDTTHQDHKVIRSKCRPGEPTVGIVAEDKKN